MNALALVVIAAAEKPLDPNDVKPGYVALSIVILMCVATFFLLRSFVKHSHKADQHWKGDSTGPKTP